MAGTILSTAQTLNVQTFSPESGGTPAAAGEIALQITFDVDVTVGTGLVTVTETENFDEIASFDITDPNDATVSGNTVTFATFTAVGSTDYNIEAPEGFVVSVAGDPQTPAPSIGFTGDELWFFSVVAPDTAGPVVESLSPQNGTGASVSPTLTVNYDENISLASGPWTIEVYDVTADEVLQSFSETDTSTVTTFGDELSITLASDLDFNNEYRVTTSAGVVMDAAGNLSGAIASGDWEFTTGDPFASGQVVISQVHGGGGNSGAIFTNDFIELHNRTASVISLEGWSVQYASRVSSNWNVTELSGSIQPGGYYLVQQAAGANTAMTADPLPTPDATGDAIMGGTGGKVAVVNSIEALTDADPFTAGAPGLSDFVGYGTAGSFEGSGATPSVGNTLAAFRKINGSQDTDDNAADFSSATPAPRNSESPSFFPGNDGSGLASASNITGDAGILASTGYFLSDTASRTMQIDLSGTLEGVTLETAEIDVPSDFTNLVVGNIGISGTGAGSGSIGLSGQTITISNLAVTTTDNLVVTISGLTTPDATVDTNDDGTRIFAIRTAISGGSLTALIESPSVTLVVPVTDLAALRAFDPTDKTFVIPNEVVVTFFDPALAFRNQHYIQDATAGILIDDDPETLAASYAEGDGLTDLVGTLSTFSGILQFNPQLASQSLSSQGNVPVPVVATLAELTASPSTYQSRLVRVNDVTFQDATGTFDNATEKVLLQGEDSFGFRVFTGADYIDSPVPTASLDLIGISRPLNNGTDSGVSPRFLADFIGDDIFPDPGDGSGTVLATNASPTAGSLAGSIIFPLLGTLQTVQIDIAGSDAETIIETVEIDVPADFTGLSQANVSISGTGAGTGSASVSGQTITVSGVAVTDTDFLEVSISGLTAPDVSADAEDDGNRTFTVRTAISGGIAVAVEELPVVRVAMPVADLATLRAVVLPSTKTYLVPNEVVVTYVENGNFRNQHYIQDASAGILIDDNPVILGASYLRGDGLINLVGTLSEFNGMLQFNPFAATANVASSNNITTPLSVTLAELTANPLTYQSRLVKVSAVTFQDSTGSFANNSQHILVQGADTFGFRTFFNAEYSGTEIPDVSLDIVGVVRTVSNVSYLSPRDLADITESGAPSDPVYADFATDFAGGQGPLLDFDGDGVPNGLEYLFGVNSTGFTATPQIVNGEITWPIDPTRTDAGYIVETSDDLEEWDEVLVEDLDLTNPNAVRFVVPTDSAPFFVRIGATFAPEP